MSEAVEIQVFEKGVVYRAIDDEPAYPDKMPDEMWAAINGDRDAMEEALRLTVTMTKAGIASRLMKKQVIKITGHPDLLNGLEEDHGG